MNDCPQCGAPLIWSTEREVVHCAIYGSHTQRPRGEFAGLVRLCMDTPDPAPRRLRVVA